MARPISKNAMRWLALAGAAAAWLIVYWLTRPKPSAVVAHTAPSEPPTATQPPAPVAPPTPPAPRPSAPAAKALPPAVQSAIAASPQQPQPQGGELQAAFEREVPDATAAQAEARIREIFKREAEFDIVFRHVICTRSVCKIDLRWSPELSDPYNGGLIKVVEEFSRELALVPEGAVGPETPMPIPMVAYIARKGYSIEGLLAERGAAAGH
jgi:hypothetical protein